MYKLSIIVPVYNKINYVEKCIDSILKWGSNGYQVIIIDDGSADGSNEIVDRYTKLQNVIVLHQENCGVSSARNAGLKLATGEYVTFVDADDMVIEGSLDRVLPYFSSQDDIYFTGAISEGEDPSLPPIFSDMVFEDGDAKAALTFLLTGGTVEHRLPGKATQFISGCKEKFYKRAFIEKHDIHFDEKLERNEDVLWSCYCYFYAERIHFIPVTVYIMRTDPNGITNGMDIYRTLDNAVLYLSKFDAFFREKINERYLGNFYFHNCAVMNYEAYRALQKRSINRLSFNNLMKKWYALDSCQFMLKKLNISDLTFFKKIAFILMKLRFYHLVGYEMSVHHSIK